MIITLLCGLALSAEIKTVEKEEKTENSEGKVLVEKVWADMKAGNLDELKAIMAEGFQSLHQDGSRNAEEELKLIAGLNLGDYKLADFVITGEGNTLIVTYFVSVEETIKGERLSSVPAPRMTIFVETEDGWKWLAHANLKQSKG